jgi:hypothetical protein
VEENAQEEEYDEEEQAEEMQSQEEEVAAEVEDVQENFADNLAAFDNGDQVEGDAVVEDQE